jgi:hypothetical protein
MFTKYVLDYERNLFDELSKSCIFEDITKGRQGANLVDVKNNLIPIIRTTTNYNNPNQQFLPIHYDIIKKIKDEIEGVELNNALIEIYNGQYRKMKFHSDQALDLTDNSYICVFSCYKNKNENENKNKNKNKNENKNENKDNRILKIKNKTTKECSDISLDHNSVVVFSTEINKQYVHKIVLDANSDNEWLGITFRLSKTFISFSNEIPYFYQSNNMLRLAESDDEIRGFTQSKGHENSIVGYEPLKIYYTISVGDMKPLI